MGLPPSHLNVINDVEVLVETLIANKEIFIIFKVEFVLYGLMQSVLDGLFYFLFRNNFVALYPVGL